MEFLGILCLILITTTLAGVACKKVNFKIASRDCVRSSDVKYCASRCVCA